MLKYGVLLLFISACIAESIHNPLWENDYSSVSHIGAKRVLKKEAQKARILRASQQSHSGYEEVARQKEVLLQQYLHFKVAEVLLIIFVAIFILNVTNAINRDKKTELKLPISMSLQNGLVTQSIITILTVSKYVQQCECSFRV